MRGEQFRERILEVTFVAFDKQRVEFFWDATMQQSREYIWKNICPTAVILFAWEYAVEAPKRIPIEKSRLTDDELEKFNKKF